MLRSTQCILTSFVDPMQQGPPGPPVPEDPEGAPPSPSVFICFQAGEGVGRSGEVLLANRKVFKALTKVSIIK